MAKKGHLLFTHNGIYRHTDDGYVEEDLRNPPSDATFHRQISLNSDGVLYQIGKKPDVETFGEGSAYTDRFMQWDYEKHNRILREVFGNERQYWHDRSPADIQRFIELWTGRKVFLYKIVQEINRSNGYPCWAFLWYYLEPEKPKEIETTTENPESAA